MADRTTRLKLEDSTSRSIPPLLPDEPPMSGTVPRHPSGVFEDVAPEGMRILKAIDEAGHLVDWRAVREELYTDDMVDEMHDNLERWARIGVRLT